MTMTEAERRRSDIVKMAQSNALEGIDQGRIEDYEDNMRDTILEQWPDYTPEDVDAAEWAFAEIVKEWKIETGNC